MREWIKLEKIPEVLAPAYEKAARLVIERYYAAVAEEIVSSGARGLLLDLGTGPGYLPIEIAKRTPHIRIIGVDLCQKLIRTATANARKEGLSDRLEFEIGNAGNLRFGESVFDMVISTGMLHSLREPLAVLKEIRRVLKPGASAWIYDPANVSPQIDRKQWRASLSPFDRVFLWFFKAIGLHRPIKPFTRNELSPLLAAAGFGESAIEERGAGEIKIVVQK